MASMQADENRKKLINANCGNLLLAVGHSPVGNDSSDDESHVLHENRPPAPRTKGRKKTLILNTTCEFNCNFFLFLLVRRKWLLIQNNQISCAGHRSE